MTDDRRSNAGAHVRGESYRKQTPQEAMIEFDSLPPPLRRAVRDLPCKANSRLYYNIWRQSGLRAALARAAEAGERYLDNAYRERGLDLSSKLSGEK